MQNGGRMGNPESCPSKEIAFILLSLSWWRRHENKSRCCVLVNVNQPSWSQVEDYDAEDDAEGEGRAVFLRWPLDLKPNSEINLRLTKNGDVGLWCRSWGEQTGLEEITTQMEIVQLMTTILSFTMFVFYMFFSLSRDDIDFLLEKTSFDEYDIREWFRAFIKVFI